MQFIRLLLLSLFLCCSPTLLADDRSWQDILERIDNKFPEVPTISTQQLAGALDTKDKPIIIDTRSKEEYQVSHLRNAVNITSVDELDSLGIDKNTSVVMYCSVGYRSSVLAEKAMEEGYTNVANLRGSIFQWANEGRAVYSGSEEVEKVHSFDEEWGKLLDEAYRSE